MIILFPAYELPSLIDIQEREAARKNLLTPNERDRCKAFAKEMKKQLTQNFPELSTIPFNKWEDYLRTAEKPDKHVNVEFTYKD